MTREDSIRTRTWVTNDGRYLTAAEITDSHLCAIRGLLCRELTPGRDEDTCRTDLAVWMAAHAAGEHSYEEEMDHDLYRVGWIQIINDELARRSLPCPA